VAVVTAPRDLRSSFERDGFVVLDQALDTGTVASVRRAVDGLLERTRDDWADDRTGYRASILQYHRARLEDPVLGALALDGRLARTAEEVLGPGLRVFLDQVICKVPGAAATIPHQDAPFLSFDDRRSVNCWIALDEVGPDNGALRYRVGSHRLGLLGMVELDGDDRLSALDEVAELPEVLVSLRPGDAVLHHPLAIHRSGANRTTEVRRAFSIQYMPESATYNGWRHEFLPADLALGDSLAIDACPKV